MANNLKIDGTQLVGIYKLIPSVHGGPRKAASTNFVPRATHDVHFTRSSLGASAGDLVNPNYDVGILFGFSAASAINRPSHSKALVHDDKLYYRMSHSDLYGQSRDVTPGSKIEGRLVQFFRLETDQSKIDLVFSKLVKVIDF